MSACLSCGYWEATVGGQCESCASPPAVSTPTPRAELPDATPHRYPDLRLSDIQWRHVLMALQRTGIKRDEAIRADLLQQLTDMYANWLEPNYYERPIAFDIGEDES